MFSLHLYKNSVPKSRESIRQECKPRAARTGHGWPAAAAADSLPDAGKRFQLAGRPFGKGKSKKAKGKSVDALARAELLFKFSFFTFAF